MIFEKGNFTDCAGRTFKEVSPWEYALWALDSDRWKILHRYIQGDQLTEALKQLNNLEKPIKEGGGITYTFVNFQTGETETRTEAHYDFSFLTNSLETYINEGPYWSTNERVKHFCTKIGAAQRMVPFYVAVSYCELELFDQLEKTWEYCPTFFDGSHYIPWFLDGTLNKPWLPASSRLGIDYAVYRPDTRVHFSPKAMCMPGRFTTGTGWDLTEHSGFDGCKYDLKRITELHESHKLELAQLKEELVAAHLSRSCLSYKK